MKSENLKCPKCGYVFEGNTEAVTDHCPLCNTEYNVNEALKLYNKVKKETTNTTVKQKSTAQIILEWIIFFGCFAGFIFVLYIIINYIIGA